MTIDLMDWLLGFLGGMLIGLSGLVILLGLGRIAGVSGIAAGLLAATKFDRWFDNVLFVVSLALAAVLIFSAFDFPAISVPEILPLLIVGGLFIGFGTRLGSGCTSGHGVCGLSRLSVRSLVATGVFMAAAMLTVFIVDTLGVVK